MHKILIKNAQIVNEGCIQKGHIFIEDSYISKIYKENEILPTEQIDTIDCEWNYAIPGIIDTHVHFREPGLTTKADIFTESLAAAAGGVTTFFDMPNTIPPTTDLKLIEDKISIAQKKSLINYSFYILATPENIDYLKKIEKNSIAGIKLFYGSSTGNHSFDDEKKLEQLFSIEQIPIVIHSEDDGIIKQNFLKLQNLEITLQPYHHNIIRSAEACFEATKKLFEIIKKHNAKVHFLHITTAEELQFLKKLKNFYNLTIETCPHYLYFDSNDYKNLCNKIKCNPAIKSAEHRYAIYEAIKEDIIDTIATDHAPHEESEKTKDYLQAPSGIPSVQYFLNILLELYEKKIISLEKIVEKTSHNPAKIFNIKKRGFIKEGYKADITIFSVGKQKTIVSKDLILSKCKWSPWEGKIFNSKILYTIVNGRIAYGNGEVKQAHAAEKIEFER